MRVNVNLASEPFQSTRPMLVASGIAAVLLAGLLVLLIALSTMEKGQATEVQARVDRLQARVTALSAEEARLQGVLRKPENAEVLDRSLFLNSLIYAKAISWTRLFDDLEKVVPHNVRLISIRPQVNARNELSLDMVVGAESPKPVIQMLTHLESSPQFGAVLLQTQIPPSQSEPLLRYRVSVNYAQKL